MGVCLLQYEQVALERGSNPQRENSCGPHERYTLERVYRTASRAMVSFWVKGCRGTILARFSKNEEVDFYPTPTETAVQGCKAWTLDEETCSRRLPLLRELVSKWVDMYL